MAQLNVLTRESVTYVGAETTFATRAGATMARLHCVADDLGVDGLALEMLDNPDDRQVRWDNPQKVPGLKVGSKFGPLRMQLKGIPSAAKLDSGGTVTALSQRPVWAHGIGREYAALGCTVGVGSTTTNIIVDDTTTLRAGQLVAVETSAGVFEACTIEHVVDSTHFEPHQALAAAPTTGLKVRGSYGYYLAEDQTDSLVIERKFTGAAGLEYRLLGCHGALKIDFPDWGKIPVVSLDGECVDWQGPTTLTASAFGTSTPAADDMDPPQLWQPVVWLASSIVRKSGDPGYAAPYRVEKLSLEIVSEWEKSHDGSRTHTIGSVHKVSGRPVAARGTITIRVDPGEEANFTAETIRSMLIVSAPGSTMFAVDVPRMYLTAKPKLVKVGKRMHMELPFEALRDTTCTLPGSPSAEALDLGYSAVRIGLI